MGSPFLHSYTNLNVCFSPKYKWVPSLNKHHTINVIEPAILFQVNMVFILNFFLGYKVCHNWWQNGWDAVIQRVFFRNHNKQHLLPPLLGQCLLDYCFPQASWVEVQHWKGDGRGWGQPGRGTVGNCFELCLIRKGLKHGHLCHFSQSVSTNFVANCGVGNKLIWLFCVKAWFPVMLWKILKFY